jgi:hypothetical protein
MELIAFRSNTGKILLLHQTFPALKVLRCQNSRSSSGMRSRRKRCSHCHAAIHHRTCFYELSPQPRSRFHQNLPIHRDCNIGPFYPHSDPCIPVLMGDSIAPDRHCPRQLIRICKPAPDKFCCSSNSASRRTLRQSIFETKERGLRMQR